MEKDEKLSKTEPVEHTALEDIPVEYISWTQIPINVGNVTVNTKEKNTTHFRPQDMC